MPRVPAVHVQNEDGFFFIGDIESCLNILILCSRLVISEM